MADKPQTCAGCPLEERGRGFTSPEGPTKAPILFVAEASGYVEALRSLPLQGPAGGYFNKLLFLGDWDRGAQRITNVCRCQPPGDFLDGAPWEHSAIAHCSQYLDPILDEGHQVVVTLGGVALRKILDLPKRKGDGISVKNFHGTVTRDPKDRFWVVPTFHPSHLLRGAASLTQVVLHDLETAREVARDGFVRPEFTLLEDPPPDQFWVWCLGYLEEQAKFPDEVWLSVDIETPDKAKKEDEGELGSDDKSFQIIRINLSYSTRVAVSVPWQEPYISMVLKILGIKATRSFWNRVYDCPRILKDAAERGKPEVLQGDNLDWMDGWHVEHSDVPRGLGFVAPFYSPLKLPWKHLSGSRPAYYGAMDGLQTTWCAHGIARDLQRSGRLEIFLRHFHDFRDLVVGPAEVQGLLIDRPALQKFREDLAEKKRTLLSEIRGMIPEGVLKLVPKGGWTRLPKPEDVEELNQTREKNSEPPLVGEVLEKRERRLVQVCLGCGAEQVPKTHTACKKEGKVPQVTVEEREVSRWYIREEFNPASPQQVLGYILSKGHKPGRNKKSVTGGPSTDKKTIDRLAQSTKDPFYRKMKLFREVDKVKGTYADGTERRLGEDDRLHTTFTNAPSTMRTSSRDPNLQNVVADKGGVSLASGFRYVVVAAKGCYLVEVDYSGIEAVQVAWYAGDPKLYRAAKLGVHAMVAADKLGRPGDLSWDDAQLARYYKQIKKEEPLVYDKCKRGVHGTHYDLTEYGLVEQFPDLYRSLADARSFRQHYLGMFPRLEKWQLATKMLAAREHQLGGDTHPYHYRHEFWDVLAYRALTEQQARAREAAGGKVERFQGRPYQVGWGKDAKRAVAFFPQSTAGGNIRDASLKLFTPGLPEYVGDAYYGRTPLRAIIHDSFLLEVPEERLEEVIRRVVAVMTAPILEQPLPWDPTQYLTLGVEVKVGRNWGAYNDDEKKGPLNLEGMKVWEMKEEATLAGDSVVPADEEDEETGKAVADALSAGAA